MNNLTYFLFKYVSLEQISEPFISYIYIYIYIERLSVRSFCFCTTDAFLGTQISTILCNFTHYVSAFTLLLSPPSLHFPMWTRLCSHVNTMICVIFVGLLEFFMILVNLGIETWI